MVQNEKLTAEQPTLYELAEQVHCVFVEFNDRLCTHEHPNYAEFMRIANFIQGHTAQQVEYATAELRKVSENFRQELKKRTDFADAQSKELTELRDRLDGQIRENNELRKENIRLRENMAKITLAFDLAKSQLAEAQRQRDEVVELLKEWQEYGDAGAVEWTCGDTIYEDTVDLISRLSSGETKQDD